MYITLKMPNNVSTYIKFVIPKLKLKIPISWMLTNCSNRIVSYRVGVADVDVVIYFCMFYAHQNYSSSAET